MAWVEKDGYGLRFGGAKFGEASNITLSDTWAWRQGGWHQLHPAVSPPGRSFPAMAYDPVSKVVLMFGGGAANSDPSRYDTWAWDGVNWTQLHPRGTPAGPGEWHLAFDPNLGRLILVQAPARHDNPDVLRMWEWGGGSWSQLGNSVIPNRGAFGLAETSAGMLLFGGSTSLGPAGEKSDTWLWTGSRWIQEQPATTPTGGPSHLVYDSGRGVNILVSEQSGATWTWNGSNWKSERGLPQARGFLFAYFFGLAADPGDKLVVLFGGKQDFPSVHLINQTWTWDGSTWRMT